MTAVTAINFIYQKHVGLSTADLSAAILLLVLDLVLAPVSIRAAGNLSYLGHYSLEL